MCSCEKVSISHWSPCRLSVQLDVIAEFYITAGM
jgi:hypothetical protein